jgi:hypothetical protein
MLQSIDLATENGFVRAAPPGMLLCIFVHPYSAN